MYTLLSPWPPQRNGIADYAYEISRHGRSAIRLVTEALAPKRVEDRMMVASADEFLRQPGKRRLYHFGNNPDHVFLAPLFLRAPGVAVIHDASLHYLAERIDPQIPGFLRRMVAEDGAADPALLFRCWRNGLKSELDYAEVRCLTWLREAPAIIVHSEYARRLVATRLPDTPIHVIPHFAYLRGGSGHSAERRDRARVALGIEPDAIVLTTMGFVTRNKQYDSVIKAIATLPPEKRRRLVYIVAGENRPEEYDIAPVIAAHGGSFVQVRGYVPPAEADHLLTASDLIVNLRYPTFGESSGSVARAQGAGAALVVSDVGAFGEIPRETCFHIPSKANVTMELAALIERVMDDPRIIDHVRQAAWTYAHERLSPRGCAARYEEIVHAH